MQDVLGEGFAVEFLDRAMLLAIPRDKLLSQQRPLSVSK